MARIYTNIEDVAEVKLVTHTRHPLRAIALAQRNMQGDMLTDLHALPREECEAIFRDVCKTELQGSLEFVHFFFQLKNVTRAFQQQLTRTRHAAYSAESLRFTEAGMQVLAGPHLVDMSKEAKDPNNDGIDWTLEMQLAMDGIETLYRDMIEDGVPTEDARGILPLNVLSKIGVSISLRELIRMSRVRMCYQSQAGEWGYVFRRIVEEIAAIEPILVEPFGAFCDVGQKCPFGSIMDRKCERDV